MTIRLHKAALLSRLREDATLATRTFEGVVPTGTQRYARMFINSGFRAPSRFTGPSLTATFTATFHWVGDTPDQAQEIGDLGMAKLVDHVLIVPGFRVRRLVHAVSRPVEIDRDVSPPKYFAVDQFDFTSDPE